MLRINGLRNFHISLRHLAAAGIFVLVLTVYLVTLPRGIGLWDAGEFVATASGLQVGHPPGAPLYLLLGRVLILLFGGTKHAALALSIFSALCAAGTVTILFLSTCRLAKRMIPRGEGSVPTERPEHLIANGIGALTLAFSDSFWSISQEQEVYALATFLGAVVIHISLRWSDREAGSRGWRPLVLIAYLLGLSVGVHPLTLLCIPAVGLILYGGRCRITFRGGAIAFLTGLATLAIVLYVLLPGALRLGQWLELLMVNGLGLSFHSGLVALLGVGLGLTAGLIALTHRLGLQRANLVVVCTAVFMLGTGSYGLILVRSESRPPINEGAPASIFSLSSYIAREQYGSPPLAYGPYYSAPVSQVEVKQRYVPEGHRYVARFAQEKYHYAPDYCTVFPRMHSSWPPHPELYEIWAGPPRVFPEADGPGRPSFGQNLRFLLAYQLQHMYWRYFLFNFVGRQNDGLNWVREPGRGNVLTGFGPLDRWRIGPSTFLPTWMREARGRHVYFALPLMLGLLGAFAQVNARRRDFASILLLFLLTGVAITLHLNQSPGEPRERDYSYVLSFYAFSLWIGLGAGYVFGILSRKFRRGIGLILPLGITLLVPGVVVAQNWNTYARGEQGAVEEVAHAILASLPPQAILITNADNDTFPLWAVQHAHGFRRDVRICSTSLLATDWYIDQMRQPQYESAALPISFQPHQYEMGTRDLVYFRRQDSGRMRLDSAIAFVRSEEPTSRIWGLGNRPIDFFPARDLYFEGAEARSFTPPRQALGKAQLIILDLLANCRDQRPIHFTSLEGDCALGLDEFLVDEGLTYRFTLSDTLARADQLYERSLALGQASSLGSVGKPLGFDLRRYLEQSRVHHLFLLTQRALTARGATDSARTVARIALNRFRGTELGYGAEQIEQVELLYDLNLNLHADSLLTQMLNHELETMRYLGSISTRLFSLQEDLAQKTERWVQQLIHLGRTRGGTEVKRQVQELAKSMETQY